MKFVVFTILALLAFAVLVILGLVPNPLDIFTVSHVCGAVQAALQGCH